MGTVEDAAQAAPKAKPTILVPQRGSEESFFAAGLGSLGFSPGPMTLVSSFFAEHGTFSFSQLLAGAMASPMAPKPDFSPVKEEEDEEEEEGKSPDYGENPVSAVGYKRNRPINLVVAQPKLQPESLSPPFMVPPGLSSSGLLNSPVFLSPLSPFGLGMSHQQALAHVTAQASLSQSVIQMQEHIQQSSFAPATDNRLPSPTNENSLHHSNPTPAEAETFKIESPVFFSLPQNKKVANVKNGKPASDGYNWRKYGQKHVKASECPRSYYKCTQVSCPVKKKVELSLEGHVLEIVYKGQHNHAPPQNSNKRGKDGCGLETNGPDEDVEVDSRPLNPLANPRLLPEQDHVAGWDNGDVENNVIVVDDGDDEEPIAKRRNMNIAHSIPVSTYQTITESKIVVQTRSEVDLLDDGYKWRKYGQKVVKGNPYPRSYYKCTSAGCNVRKHVERAPTDPKVVITTYEGKHNHEIPSGRHSAYANANPQPLKAQRSAAKNLSEAGEMDFGNQDKIPVTLLKEEQIAT